MSNSYLQKFKYELSGPEDAPKLVFLHGVMGSGANWQKIAKAFQKKFRVLTYDQRGHGASFKPLDGYSTEDYAMDLKHIIDELGWDKIILIGHSMGGRNALHFAYKFPQIVLALIIEDIGPEGNKAAMQKNIDLVERVPTPFTSKQAAKNYFDNEFVKTLPGMPNARVLAQFFYANIVQFPNGSADWRFSKKAILASLLDGYLKSQWDAVKALSMPTLFVRGRQSEVFSQEEYNQVLDVNPKIQGVEINDAGHWVHFDKPDAFVHTIQKFLQKNLGFDFLSRDL
ncbi:MAG: hypothetical protein A2Z20_08815 [Bdellovibrionales bacterium RBG_16_40_8]|nr:MAG: hypothetical protein A2Z20_08815 [Bdellovibrionales bacterium RBG_16_40_8]